MPKDTEPAELDKQLLERLARERHIQVMYINLDLTQTDTDEAFGRGE